MHHLFHFYGLFNWIGPGFKDNHECGASRLGDRCVPRSKEGNAIAKWRISLPSRQNSAETLAEAVGSHFVLIERLETDH